MTEKLPANHTPLAKEGESDPAYLGGGSGFFTVKELADDVAEVIQEVKKCSRRKANKTTNRLITRVVGRLVLGWAGCQNMGKTVASYAG